MHPRRNVDEFPPVPARFIRFTVLKTNRGEPCLDELEIFTASDPLENAAAASAGAKITVSGTLPGFRIHKAEHVNDGFYGNGRSWISSTPGRGWVEVELPREKTINKVVWGRDREGKFIDRLPTEYRIETAAAPGEWRLAASSQDRRPLEMGAEYFGSNPAQRLGVNRFAPVQTTLSPDNPNPSSREYTLRVWQTEDGLPSNTITAITQTRDGYLWIGTFNGLVRFDGVRFVTYGETEGLRSPRITCLLQDRAGSLWIGTEGGGLSRREGQRFVNYTTTNGLSSNVILSLAQDENQTLWIGTFSGLDSFDGERLQPAPLEYGLRGKAIHRLLAAPEGHLWIYADNLRLLAHGQITAPPFPDEPGRFTSLLAIHQGRSGDLWVGGANGYVARMRAGKAAVFGNEQGLLPDIVWEICEAQNGDVWVGTASGGLSRLRDGRFITLTTQDGLSNNSVRALFEDAEGTLWAGTNGGGLIRLRSKRVSAYTTHHGLSHDVVMSLAEDSSRQIWVGSNCGGLNIFRDGAFAPYSINYLLDNECIWPLVTGQNGTLWIGAWGGGLFLKSGDRIVNFLKSDGLSDETILSLCQDRAGGLWIGTYTGGLNHLVDGQFTHYTTRHGLPANTVTAILETAPGELWIGTSGGGLARFAGGRFTPLQRPQGLASDFVRTLYQDAEGRLWIGASGGLSLLEDGQCRSLFKRHGLIDPIISQILEDDQGHLWLGSNQGISRIPKQELLDALRGQTDSVHPLSFGREEGMESVECTGGFHPAGLKASDGALWFSTVKGVVRVNPRGITINTNPPQVQIEEMWVDGKSTPIPTSARPVPRLSPNVQRLEIVFTALSLAAPHKVKFKYRLLGLEETWNDAGTHRLASYAHLSPGQYQFQVIACNNVGVWNTSGAALPFTILPPFWKTWWFMASGTFAAIALVGGAARYVSLKKMRDRLQRLEQQHALEKERTRIARDIHDDLGAGLTQISLLSELARKNHGSSQNPEAHFLEISQCTRDIIQSMDAIVWAVNPKNDSLDHLANYLPQFAKDFLRSAGIRCRFDVPPLLPHVPLSAEIRHNLFLAVKEALHNVIKHSRASEVWIRLGIHGRDFQISIEDNGQGFPPAPTPGARPGNGLLNMQKRLEEMAGSARFHPAQSTGGGAKVILTLPLPAPLPPTLST